jgi:Domain of unknown function DUF37.
LVKTIISFLFFCVFSVAGFAQALPSGEQSPQFSGQAWQPGEVAVDFEGNAPQFSEQAWQPGDVAVDFEGNTLQFSGQAWQPKEVDYGVEIPPGPEFHKLEGSLPEVSVKLFVNAYRLIISNPDGERCPFSPSCSRFFVEAVKQTNIFEAILLSSDRLIRDTSAGNRLSQYSIDATGHLIDPPSRYIDLE